MGLRIQLLDQSQEAKATIQGYIWKEKEKLQQKSKDFLLIDQGGGSTEITSFSYQNNSVVLRQTANITIGTASTIQSFQNQPNLQTSRKMHPWSVFGAKSRPGRRQDALVTSVPEPFGTFFGVKTDPSFVQDALSSIIFFKNVMFTK